MLAVEGVNKSFAGARSRVVLHDVSLHLAAGEYIAVMGESGAGKSTLLNLIAGLDVPDSGRIVVAGQDMAALDDAARTRLRRARMGFVFQAFHLLPHLSVARNVGLPLALNGAATDAIAARVEEMLAAVGMQDRRDDLPNQLSGGEMQRVAIARALAHRPSLVLADEPTGNLDADSAAEVLALLRAQLERDNAAGILVTHSEVAAATAQRVYRLTHRGLHERTAA
jgi:putative ABC transport system ATP-binding protein